MRNVKIVLVGAGSASFGAQTLGDIFNCGELAGSEIWLVDVDERALDVMWRLAVKLNESWESGLRVARTCDLSRALPGADFVVSMAEVNRDRLWQLDLMIPHKYGVQQALGENGGPGGLSHTLRSVPLVLSVARQMEALCPDAWLLNYTNPVPRVCRAIRRYTPVQAIGLCHGIGGTINTVAAILGVEPGAVDVKAAGLNHFHWLLDVRFKETGEDAYAILREREPGYRAGERRLWRDLFRRVGIMPFPSDDHVAEYLPFMHVAAFGPWEKYNHDHWLLHWDGGQDQRDAMWTWIRNMGDGSASLEDLREGSGERGIPVLLGIRDNLNSYELALNIPNRGYVGNLPEGCIVEVPAVVSGLGVQGLPMGDLPAAVAGWCNIQVYVAELAVEAAVTGDRDIALQALLVDPVINDLDVAEKILDEYLAVHADYLPQFAQP